MNQSESIANLALALAKAQKTIKGAVKDSNNPFFKSTYADLSSVWEACHDALNDNDLCVIQTMEPVSETAKATVVTTLAHKSGEWIKSTLTMTAVKNDPQAIGSAITYARRYSLAAITGVCAIEDDDGNSASHAAQPPQAEKKTKICPTCSKQHEGQYAKCFDCFVSKK